MQQMKEYVSEIKAKIERNDKCICRSGKKNKFC